ncbi:MAG: hypothetical protein Q4E70_02940 [Candidatus Saccharibacteria bacterium]|nr:hypothetical protein [Candidatus Saccharibacteria bacterium]
MFFKNLKELENILKNSGTSIICLKDGEKVGDEIFSLENLTKTLGNCLIIENHNIDQIREVINLTTTKTSSPRFFLFKNAEKLQIQAQNSALKLFEEPKENYHFILFTTTPDALLPTIRSRAAIYTPLKLNALETPPEAEKEVFELSKRLLVANQTQVLDIAEELHKRKDTEKSPRREFVLEVLKTTIELAEKSYFKTKNEAFTKKINGLIKAHENISKNGIIRLQIVANLI